LQVSGGEYHLESDCVDALEEWIAVNQALSDQDFDDLFAGESPLKLLAIKKFLFNLLECLQQSKIKFRESFSWL
jgi:hypothetical protein